MQRKDSGPLGECAAAPSIYCDFANFIIIIIIIGALSPPAGAAAASIKLLPPSPSLIHWQ